MQCYQSLRISTWVLFFGLALFRTCSSQSESLQFLGQTPFTTYVSRAAPPKSIIYSLVAINKTDGRPDGITYSLVEGSHDLFFEVNSHTGQLTITQYLPLQSFVLDIQAKQGSEIVKDQLTVLVLPEYNISSFFEQNMFTFSLSEYTPINSVFAVIRAFSLDPANNVQRYSILSGNAGNDLEINSTTGFLTVVKQLDHETISSYNLLVQYSDTRGEVSVKVEIIVLDENDNPPEFSDVLYEITLTELIAAGTVILRVIADDRDSPTNGDLEYFIPEGDVSFEIEHSTGVLYTTKSLDYEQESCHVLTVVARDSGIPSLNSTVIVVVNVLNQDDECPVFESTYYAAIFPPESSLPDAGMEVVTVHALDPDIISNVSYTLVSGGQSHNLNLDVHSGAVTLLSASPNTYNLNISASDATCINKVFVEVVINIGNSNNHIPQFTGPCEAQVQENISGTVITTLVATDNDEGTFGKLTYTFSDENSLFTIDSVNNMGVVTLSDGEMLDYEMESQYLIGVIATDGGNKQAYCLLNITVLDVNDNPPAFLTSDYAVTIPINPPIGTYIVQVLAEDADDGLNRVIHYTLSGSNSDDFMIDPNSGVITTANTLTQNQYTLSVQAGNDNVFPMSSSAEVTIDLESDTSLPIFNQSLYSTTICENLPFSSPVLQVFPNSSADGIIYSLISGSLYYTNGENILRINQVQGIITVSSQGAVDFERLPDSKFIFSVRAQNLQNYASIATVEVNVLDSDDNVPTFQPDNVQAAVSENSPPGTLVTQLVARDPDSGTNSIMEYTLSVGEDKFSISNSGELTTLMEFDAENALQVTNNVRVTVVNPSPTDTGETCQSTQRQSGTVVVTVNVVDVNDNPPSFLDHPTNLTLPENTPLDTDIYTFTATDPDSSDSDRLGYTIISGNMEYNFVIDNAGALKLVRYLDYERRSIITLTIQVSDGVYSETTTFTILVTDVDDEPPLFMSPTYTIDIVENTSLGTRILQVSATDVDTPTINLVYWLTGPAEGRFAIDSNGVITTTGTIDREEFQDGIISFLAVAEGGAIATALINITVNDVNDYVPRFANVDLTVPENVSPNSNGISIGRVLATDLDMGRNGTVSYTLLIGEDYHFEIDSETGEITAYGTYDREDTAFYTLVVEAKDMGEDIQSSTTALRVRIGDENDNAPFFPFPYVFTRIFENSNTGAEVIQIPAIDLDEGSNAALEYTLLSSEPIQLKFAVDNRTGIVTQIGSLDYEIPLHRSFNLTFSIADPDYVGAYDATLEIQLLDQNDNSPVFTSVTTPLGSMISETIPVGTVILQVSASDEDSGTNAEVVFSIVSGDPNGDFDIVTVGTRGAVSTVHQLDYETKSKYNLTIEVCDLGTPSQCSTESETVSLSIINVNDEEPAFSQTIYEGIVVENANPVTSILHVMATDKDFGERFEYGIESGNNAGKFVLNSTSGILGSTVRLDREEQDIYVLVITAADEGGTPLSGTGTAIITVQDVDDNPPANDSQWEIHMLLLDGELETEQSVDIYFSDPDSTNEFTDCITVGTENTVDPFTVDRNRCILRIRQGSLQENSHGIMVRMGATESTVNIQVEHISLREIPVKYLVTISLAMSIAHYLNTAYTTFPTSLATTLGIDPNKLTIVSIQGGYHDHLNIVDISFTVKGTDNSYINPSFILQILYIKKDILKSLGFELTALPTDPCSSEPCINQAICKSLKTIRSSSLVAQSPPFYLIAPTIELSYECECVPGTSGQDCSVNFDDCYSNPCHYGAQCIDEVNGFRCDCPSGTSGVDCSITPNECSSNPCKNGAVCQNTPGSYSCLCLPGFYGSDCQYHYFRTALTCNSNPCVNDGVCSPGRDSFTCLCPSGYTGQHCEMEAVTLSGCSGNPCYNGSTCADSPSGPICSCSVGFTGPFCRWQIDNCELNPCRNGGTCAPGVYGSYQCYCPLPYTGQNCENFISGCGSSPCMNGGRCSDTSEGNYICECIREYSGDNCEYLVQPMDLCSSGPCLSGNCTYGHNSYTCSCPAGRSGLQCENESPPSLACDSNPCQHGSECVESSSDYSCLCSPGFTGTNCQTNIDECESNPCSSGICKDGLNGYLCECPTTQITGYNCEVVCPNGLIGNFCDVATVQCQNQCQNGGTCVEDQGSFFCICPPLHTGTLCERESTCDAVECFNGGTCSVLEDSSYGCICSDGFDGTNCQLLSVSFSQLPSQKTYRAYPSLHLRGQGMVEFEFNTLDSDGLLLYNTQLQSGESSDYIAVEVLGGHLAVSVSYGDNVVSIVLTGGVTLVNDGYWHHVTIEINGKSVSVTLDFCHDLDAVTGASAGCYSTAVTEGQKSYIDLGLPLWLGGIPVASSHVSNEAITACMRQVYINGVLLDLKSTLDQSNSESGCPQLDSQCMSGECGAGNCIPMWSNALCTCPPLMSGDLCDNMSPSLTYTGRGYAHYTLTELGAGEMRSTYQDYVSFSLRTVQSEAILFSMQDKSGSEYLHIRLESGQAVLHLNLGSEETLLMISEQQVNDSQRHNVTVSRTGHLLNLTLDSNTLEHTLSFSSPLTLETDPSEIYSGGSPYNLSWFAGCLQDIRINQFSLPTVGSNTFASVMYEGSQDGHTGITEGCSLSPCYRNPCGSGGMCEEINNNSYQCVCSGGERTFTVCPESTDQSYILFGAVSLGFILFVVFVTIPACVCFWRHHKKKRTYIFEATDKIGSQELAENLAPSQGIVISNEQGGGEADTTNMDWTPLNAKCASPTKSSPASSRTTTTSSSKGSTLSSTSHTSTGSRKKYRFQLPVPEKEEVDEGGKEDENIRSNSPVIRAYLEERVNTANDEVLSVDSLRKFHEEGSENSEVDSLSSVLNSDSEEEYTLERLRAAGPPLSTLTPLLQHALQNRDASSRESSTASDIFVTLHTSQ